MCIFDYHDRGWNAVVSSLNIQAACHIITTMNKHDVKIERNLINEQQPKTGYDHGDPSLIAGPGGLTVWDLKRMAQEKRFSELDNLFDNGLTMNALPVGLAAGTP